MFILSRPMRSTESFPALRDEPDDLMLAVEPHDEVFFFINSTALATPVPARRPKDDHPPEGI